MSRRGKSFARLRRKLLDVCVGGMVLRRQRHHNVGIRSADRRRIAVGEINAAVWQANVVDDAFHFVGRDLLPDRILDLDRTRTRCLQCACRLARAYEA